jgi:hypothetical protein
MDDLEHGLECLLGDFLPEDRQQVADRIASDLAGLVSDPDGKNSDAAWALVLETQRFAAFGGDGASVRAAFRRFAVDDGPAIGRRQQASEAARRSVGRRVAVNADREDRHIAWLAVALKRLRPRAPNVAHAASLIADKIAHDRDFAGTPCPEDMPGGLTRLRQLIKRVPNLAGLLR